MNLLSHKKLLIYIVTVFTLCTTNHAMEHDERAERKQGNLSGVNAGGNISQAFNEHRGGEGGRAEVHNHIGSAPLSPKTALDYFYEGKAHRSAVPPRENEAMLSFENAASVIPNPHIEACIICAEHFSKLLDVKESNKHYINALKALKSQGGLEEGETDRIYSGLMKLYYEAGRNTTNIKMKKDYLKKAMGFRKEITTLNGEEEYTMLDDLEAKLSELEIGGVGGNGGSAAAAAPQSIPQTMTRSYPAIARGYEAIYDRFINGRLVYKGPAGERSFLIADIINPSLEGEFNLSGLTYTSGSTTYNIDTYLRIRLGYRKSVENDEKVTVWLVPKFVVSGVESSFSTVEWTSDIGIFWTYGKGALSSLDYLTNQKFDEISSKNLYELLSDAPLRPGCGVLRGMSAARDAQYGSFFLYF